MTMRQNLPNADGQAAHADGDAGSRLLELLGDRLSARASVAAVFGEPIVCDRVTVIPVARVRLGFGGGSGRQTGTDTGGEGGGGGGGADARPLGFVEVSNGAAVYRHIRDPWTDIVIPLAALAAILTVPRLIRRRARRHGPKVGRQ